MIYLDYELYKRKYLQTQQIYDSILSEKERMLRGHSNSKKLKQIDEKLDGLKASLDGREKLLKMKEKELRESNNPDDIVYRLRYIERMKVKRISYIVHYSDTQVYRMLQNIQNAINETIIDS